VASGAAFTVTVKTQPSAPTQTCNVIGGSGTVGGADVSSVVVNCSTNEYTIGGSITGLSGTGLILQDNGGDALSVTADGTFAFATPIKSGATFAVTVKTQPSSPTQTCSVNMGSGTVVAANVTTVSVHCSTNAYFVGGAVSGLAGSGLVLQDNLGDNLPIAADGTFHFTTEIASGATYSVTVLTQPTSLSQTCTVTNGSGLIGNADVTNVAVDCTTNTYTVGGTVTGLQGSGLILQDNGGDDLPIAADGTFHFMTPVASGATFSVTVFNQPTAIWQTCTVSGDSGTVTNANITSVMVNCAANQYAIGGTVSGLDGTGLKVSLNGGAPHAISANGTWAFPTTLASGTSYTVTITGQPQSNWQTCTLSGDTGSVSGSNVTDVDITCTTNTYAVGGTVSGVAGTGVTLQDNNGDDLTVGADGTFKFLTKVASGQPYSVTVSAQPTAPWQTCVVANGAGPIRGGDITNVAVTCTTNTYAVGGTISGLGGTVVLQDNLGDDKTLTADGPFVFDTKLASGGSYSVTVLTQPGSPSQTCTVSAGSGPITNADIGSVDITCVTNTFVIGGSVTGLVGSGLVLRDNGGDDLPIGSDGSFKFNTKVASGQTYAVTVFAQPDGPAQTCTVGGDSGTVGGADVTTVAVNCSTNTYTVGGTVSGLNGATGLVLQDNLGDDRSVSADGTFAFATPVASGDAYSVSVKTQPTSPWETCTVTNETGTITNANITNVSVSCAPNPYALQVTVTGLAGSGLVLQNNGGDNLSVAADGTYPFQTLIASGSTYDVTVLTQPTTPWQTCSVASPTGTMPNGATLAVTCVTNRYTIGGTVTGLTGSGLVLQDNGGDDKSIAAAGGFTFATAVTSGGTYNVTVKTQPAQQYCTVTSGSGTVAGTNIGNVAVSCVNSGCGRFSIGATGSWGLGAVYGGGVPGFSDISPIGAGAIYSISSSSLYKYTISSASWSTVATTAPVSFGGWNGPAWIGNNLYFLYSGSAYRYDMGANSWATLATGLPSTSYNDNARDVAGNIYTIDANAKVIQFTPATNGWREIAPTVSIGGISEPHIAYDSCSGLLYLVPSFGGTGLFSMNPADGTTVQLASIPSGQISDGFCSDNSGHLYAAGTAMGQQFYQYNISSNSWSALPTPPASVGNCGSCSVGDDGKLYFVGGCGSSNQTMSIQLN